MRPAERVAAAVDWLAGVGGSASPGELGAALGLNHARQADTIRAMRGAVLVEGGRSKLVLTPAGWTAVAGLASGGAGSVLDEILSVWPGPHRAFAESMVCATIARHHLGEQRPEGHAGFIAIGETATFKTAVGRWVVDVFGFDPVLHELYLPNQAPGGILGRRLDRGDGLRFEPSPATRLPFLVLDEAGKADPAVRRLAWTYLDGRRRLQIEGEVLVLAPTVLLAANPPTRHGADRYDLLRPEYRRRAFVLDSGYLRGRDAGLARLLHARYGDPRRATLDLARLKPPAVLDAEAVALLELLPTMLTKAGFEEYPGLPAMELVTLGRLALLGPEVDHRAAAMQTVIAYATVAATVPGQVTEHWGYDLAAVRDYLGNDAGTKAIAAAQARAHAAAEQGRRALHATRRAKASADLQVIEAGAGLQAQLRQLHDGLDGRRITALPAQHRAGAAGLRKVLNLLANKAGSVTTAASLDDLRQGSRGPHAD